MEGMSGRDIAFGFQHDTVDGRSTTRARGPESVHRGKPVSGTASILPGFLFTCRAPFVRYRPASWRS